MIKSISRSCIIAMLFFCFIIQSNAQDIQFVRQQLERLCSQEFHGRGYYKKGDSLAAEYLADQFNRMGLKPYGTGYFQEYAFNVNDLTEVSLTINGREMIFGVDYMIHPSSNSFTGGSKPVIIDADVMKKPTELLEKIMQQDGHSLVIIDSIGLNNTELYNFIRAFMLSGIAGISSVLEIHSDVPGGRVGRNLLPLAHFQVNRESLPANPLHVKVNVRNRYHEQYSTRNIIGHIPGQTNKTIVFTAHYDMLGSFGEGNFFPGASDNASGTAMVLDLVRHFSSGERPYYTIAFMLFSGEEAGLLGSDYYTGNPLFPLENIELVINLDMVGTGQDGVILFNGPQRPREAAIVQKINREKQYMVEIEERDGRPNSDHFPFHAKGVPAIFFLTKGRAGRAHQISDTPDKLPLYGYENLFKLIVDTLGELQRQEIGPKSPGDKADN